MNPDLPFRGGAYGILTKDLRENVRKPASVPACSFCLLSSTQIQNQVLSKRCKKDKVMGEGSVRETDTWQQHHETPVLQQTAGA